MKVTLMVGGREMKYEADAVIASFPEPDAPEGVERLVNLSEYGVIVDIVDTRKETDDVYATTSWDHNQLLEYYSEEPEPGEDPDSAMPPATPEALSPKDRERLAMILDDELGRIAAIGDQVSPAKESLLRRLRAKGQLSICPEEMEYLKDLVLDEIDSNDDTDEEEWLTQAKEDRALLERLENHPFDGGD